MKHIEIEWKFLPPTLSDGLEYYPHREFLQGYLSASPTVRAHHEDEARVLTYKGSGLLKREEYNLPLTAESFAHLLEKYDGLRIRKVRYLTPSPGAAYTVEFDRFRGKLAGLLLIEVELSDEASARAFTSPAQFGKEVTGDSRYQNSSLSRSGLPGRERA